MESSRDPVADTASPCIGVCQLNADDLCVGCGRSLQEIAGWSTAADETKRAIAAAAARRLAMIGKEPSQQERGG